MRKIILCVLALACFVVAQQPQQPTPQQTVTALVSQQAQLSGQIITVLNQVPDLVKQVQDLQKENADLKAQSKEPKSAHENNKFLDSLNIELKKAYHTRDSCLKALHELYYDPIGRPK